ncbi:HNH endonuclease [Streptomyces sp. AJS327]|uniref:HNH endonuclease n=1 Tax=Streptomyces sp. AJS327 TaxID=2545265 RepID=UPI0015DF531B|nr:HNH endonuclease signature motif containing protein [Streptomyces sp. AJS327]
MARPDPYDRGTVLARWSGCAYCLGPAEELDHVHPVSAGGRDVESNLVGVCRQCNAAKSDQSLADWALDRTAPTETR